MDLVVADITHLPEQALPKLREAEIIGKHMPVDRVAQAAGTIGYEILTRLGNRFNRSYTD